MRFIKWILFLFLFISCASTKSVNSEISTDDIIESSIEEVIDEEIEVIDPIKQELYNPTITEGISEENRKLEEYFLQYHLYKELVDIGFNIHELDYMTDFEAYNYIASFFESTETKPFFDGHTNVHYISDKDFLSINDKSFDVFFTDKYGTKEELLAEGYIENKTMFYYPSNGEKDWRVGKWIICEDNIYKLRKEGLFWKTTKRPLFKDLIKIEEGYTDYCEFDNLVYIKYKSFCWDFPEEILLDKDYLIFDVRDNSGGYTINWISKINYLKNYKKIIILINQRSMSAAEAFLLYSKENELLKDKIIIIGNNSGGVLAGSNGNSGTLIKINNLQILLSIEESHPQLKDIQKKYFYLEGYGVSPDIWAITQKDIIFNIKSITGLYDLPYNY